MLSQRYKITQLTADNELIRVRLNTVGGLRNDEGLNAVVGFRDSQITWAVKASEASSFRLGDMFTLALTADVKAG